MTPERFVKRWTGTVMRRDHLPTEAEQHFLEADMWKDLEALLVEQEKQKNRKRWDLDKILSELESAGAMIETGAPNVHPMLYDLFRGLYDTVQYLRAKERGDI